MFLDFPKFFFLQDCPKFWYFLKIFRNSNLFEISRMFDLFRHLSKFLRFFPDFRPFWYFNIFRNFDLLNSFQNFDSFRIAQHSSSEDFPKFFKITVRSKFFHDLTQYSGTIQNFNLQKIHQHFHKSLFSLPNSWIFPKVSHVRICLTLKKKTLFVETYRLLK